MMVAPKPWISWLHKRSNDIAVADGYSSTSSTSFRRNYVDGIRLNYNNGQLGS